MPTDSDPPFQAPSSAAEAGPLLHAAHERVLRMVHKREPLRAILSHLATTAEALSDSCTVASILVLDKDGLLRNGASPNLPAAYLDAIDRLRPDASLGTCSAAAATGEIVITPSFHDDVRWATLRHLPLALGFLGAWSMPIKSVKGRVLGTFGTYFREEHRRPTGAERESVGSLASLAALAIGTQAHIRGALD